MTTRLQYICSPRPSSEPDQSSSLGDVLDWRPLAVKVIRLLRGISGSSLAYGIPRSHVIYPESNDAVETSLSDSSGLLSGRKLQLEVTLPKSP